MADPIFSVHKSMVLSNRKALALYLFKMNRSHDIPEIMIQAVDLDQFDGDRAPLEIVTKEIQLAVHTLQDDYLGLRVMDLVDIKSLPLFNGLQLCITPLLNAGIEIPFIVLCRLIARYFKVMTESIQVHLIEEKNALRLDFLPSLPQLANYHQTDGVILMVHKILSVFSSVRPSRIAVSYRYSSHGMELYQQLFGICAEISTTTNSLYYDSKNNYQLQMSSIEASELTDALERTFFIGPLQYMLDKSFPESTYTERCQHILMTLIGISEATRESVAQVLNMSVSSLQRRLREEHISFQTLLLATRKKMAHQYLIEQELSATDVAFLLGYQSSSPFFKAFKRWYAMTPIAYQKLYRGQC